MCDCDLLRIQEGWDQTGRLGRRLGPDILVGRTHWTPVLWETEEDPDFHKSSGLEKFKFKSAV